MTKSRVHRRTISDGLTRKFLNEILRYDPSTGTLYNRYRPEKSSYWNKRFSNKKTGGLHSYGGIGVWVDGVLYQAHCLIWIMMTGEHPSPEIDHIDGDRANNRWKNLRIVMHAENMKNQKPRNGSPHKGAKWNKRMGRWQAAITVNYKRLHLGTFDTAEEAHGVYCKAAKKLHGKFARLE
jgi:hypothetical protein